MTALDDVIESVARAHSRLDARPGHSLRCGWCGHEAPVPDDPERSVYRCDQCGTRTSYGAQMARATVEPHPDRRYVVLKLAWGTREKPNQVAVALDREYAAGIAMEMLSAVEPRKHAAILALLARLRDVPGAPKDEAVATLDEPLDQ